jgi:hypothetical protein
MQDGQHGSLPRPGPIPSRTRPWRHLRRPTQKSYSSHSMTSLPAGSSRELGTGPPGRAYVEISGVEYAWNQIPAEMWSLDLKNR